MITLSKLELAIMTYIKEQLAVQANGVNKFLLYTLVGLKGISFEFLYSKYLPILKQVGIVNENNEIDIENLLQAMHSAFKESKTVELMGIRFDEKDLDALESYIKKLS